MVSDTTQRQPQDRKCPKAGTEGGNSTRNAPIRGCSNLADFFSFFLCYHVPYHTKKSQGILKNKKPSLPSIFRRQYYSKEHPLHYYNKFLPSYQMGNNSLSGILEALCSIFPIKLQKSHGISDLL